MNDLSVSDRLAAAPRTAGASVANATIPPAPGVYCWWREDDPLYVAPTDDLRRQIAMLDTRPRQKPVPAFRQFVRGRVQLLGDLARGAALDERAAAIDRFIGACEVSWLPASSVDEARLLAAHASQDLLESDTWHARPGEDRWLRRHLDRFDRPGRVYVEVPIGKSPGRRPRRIDAVRFDGLPDAIRYFDRAAFDADIRAHPAELIEVKRTLNRAVIGQLVVAHELARTEWKSDMDALRLVALVTDVDPALVPLCETFDIDVQIVERLGEDPLPEE